eukprot:3247515-Pleurochrysis_carterae.AAC.1
MDTGGEEERRGRAKGRVTERERERESREKGGANWQALCAGTMPKPDLKEEAEVFVNKECSERVLVSLGLIGTRSAGRVRRITSTHASERGECAQERESERVRVSERARE